MHLKEAHVHLCTSSLTTAFGISNIHFDTRGKIPDKEILRLCFEGSAGGQAWHEAPLRQAGRLPGRRRGVGRSPGGAVFRRRADLLLEERRTYPLNRWNEDHGYCSGDPPGASPSSRAPASGGGSRTAARWDLECRRARYTAGRHPAVFRSFLSGACLLRSAGRV